MPLRFLMTARSFLTNIRAVSLKEVRTLTRSPLLYVLGAVFLGLAGYFFYTDVLYFDLLNQDKIGLTQGLWQRFFEDLRLCLLLVTPVLATRLFAEERRLGTMEMLLTYPLTEGELVNGKFLSLVLLFIPLLVATILYPLVLSQIWPVDPWPLVATYLGTALLSVVCLSCGMFCSALATQQSAAALATFGGLFFFWFLAWNEAAAGPGMLAVLRRLSLFDRFYDFSRGTVQSRDVIYFFVVATLFVLFSLAALQWRWQQGRGEKILRLVGYQWQKVMLAQAGAVPQDCRFLFVPGPTHDFADAELSAVEQFLAAGGSALLLLDPLPLPRIEEMLGRYHILPGGEIVPQGAARLYLRDRQTVPVVDVALSPSEPERFTAVLYGVRRVDYVAVGNDMSGGVFLGYRSPTQGLIPVGIAVETAGEHGGRLMVVGDADFLAGALFLRDSNRTLFTHMLHWLGERRGRESQARARYAYAPLTVGQSRLLFWTVMAPPLAFLAAGGFAWWQRRRGERLET